jgi:hypothetical protein
VNFTKTPSPFYRLISAYPDEVMCNFAADCKSVIRPRERSIAMKYLFSFRQLKAQLSAASQRIAQSVWRDLF